MAALKERAKKRAGLVAFAVATVVFGTLSLVGPHRAAAPALVRVPIVARFVPRGQRITGGDIGWVLETRLRPFKFNPTAEYARVPLLKGEVLSPADLGNVHSSWVLVEVAPASGIETGVARLGGLVDVLVTAGGQVVWQSGPVAVVGRNFASGASPSISVALSLAKALDFEREQSRGTVSLVGIGS